jgi:putative protease
LKAINNGFRIKKSENKPELLAPAGNLACALTAFDCGADAVYAGLNKFNARERTENFSMEEMSKLIAYARLHSRKVYVALNTLIKESELPEIVQHLAGLARLQPDAVIVQDLGALRIIREYFPSLKIHASTQMGFHNSPGIELAAELGVSRVIMERQATLDELRKIAETSPLELEVFIHGALCCCLSGQCLFSSWMGGWSGNRGKCKQPCRRRFFSRSGNGFFFSTKDLYTLEMIPQLKEIGVASLKIEGRLRKPDYVMNVVTAYRMILDAEGEPDQDLIKKAKNILTGAYGRKWSSGFYAAESASGLIQHDSLGAAGMLCGNVAEVGQYGFKMEAIRRVHVGDRIRIQPQSGDEGPALTVTKMMIDNHPVKYAGRGDVCFICCDKEIHDQGMVYKIGQSCDEMLPRIVALPPARARLDFNLKVSSGGFEITIGNGLNRTWTKDIQLAPPAKHALAAGQLIEEFAASRSEIFCPGEISAELAGDFFVPSSVLKEIRREFWQWVGNNIVPEETFGNIAAAMERFRRDYLALHKASVQHEIESVLVRPGGCTPAKRSGHVACSVFDADKKTDEAVLPGFCSEDRLKGLASRIAEAYRIGIRRFRVSSLYGLKMFKNYSDIKLIASFSLPVCNSMAVKELERFGVSRVQAWVELERGEIENLVAKSVLPVEIYRYGRPALLATRASLPADGHIHDIKHNSFSIRHDPKAGLAYVYSKSVMSIPRVPGTADFYDLSNAYWNEDDTATFNFDLGLM